MNSPQTSQQWAYEYLPYVGHDNNEIPCFRIYPEDEPEEYVAETNEHLSHDIQERYALLMTAAPDMFSALKLAESQLSEYCAADDGRDKDAHLALNAVREAIARATGRAP
jgi:hypothetical protein